MKLKALLNRYIVTLLNDFARESRYSGFNDNYSIASQITFLRSRPNTISVSTALMLRNLLRFPDEIQPLLDDPSCIGGTVIMELLRRDNHVKALSRQVHSPFELRGYDMRPGDSLYIFYLGVNRIRYTGKAPLALYFTRGFTRDNQNTFGGARYACIGSRIAQKYFELLLPGLLECLPGTARILEGDIYIDADWVAEWVIINLPIQMN